MIKLKVCEKSLQYSVIRNKQKMYMQSKFELEIAILELEDRDKAETPNSLKEYCTKCAILRSKTKWVQ